VLDDATRERFLARWHLSWLAPHLDVPTRDLVAFCDRVFAALSDNPVVCDAAAAWQALPDEARDLSAFDTPAHDADLREAVCYAMVMDAVVRTVAYQPRIGVAEPAGGRFFNERMVEAFVEARRTRRWQDHASLFERLKVSSVDVGLGDVIRAKKDPTAVEMTFAQLPWLLSTNILEAMAQDAHDGRADNADAGFELMIEPASRRPMPGLGNAPTRIWQGRNDHGLIENTPPLPLAWAHLYQSWNLAVVSRYANAPYFWAKLAIPAVSETYLGAPGLYLYFRMTALYLHIQHEMMWRVERGSADVAVDWRHDGLARVWGAANLRAAAAYRADVTEALTAAGGEAHLPALHRRRRWVGWAWRRLAGWLAWWGGRASA
jgi:hypothetical protein